MGMRWDACSGAGGGEESHSRVAPCGRCRCCRLYVRRGGVARPFRPFCFVYNNRTLALTVTQHFFLSLSLSRSFFRLLQHMWRYYLQVCVVAAGRGVCSIVECEEKAVCCHSVALRNNRKRGKQGGTHRTRKTREEAKLCTHPYEGGGGVETNNNDWQQITIYGPLPHPLRNNQNKRKQTRGRTAAKQRQRIVALPTSTTKNTARIRRKKQGAPCGESHAAANGAPAL